MSIIPYFFRKIGKMSQTSSSAVVIGALRVKKSTKILCADSKYTNVVEENFIVGQLFHTFVMSCAIFYLPIALDTCAHGSF